MAFPQDPLPTNNVANVSTGMTGHANSAWGALNRMAAVPSRQRHVATTGNDTTGNGSSSYPFLTLQKAYDDLGGNSTDNSGKVWVWPGSYDVGSGLNLDRRKLCVFEGVAGLGEKTGGVNDTSGGARIRSASGAAALVNCQAPAASVINAYGFEFRSLLFQATHASTLTALDMKTNVLLVEDCAFSADPAVGAHDGFVAIRNKVDATRNDDASWVRILNNGVREGALCQLGTPGTGENSNRHVIDNNVVFGRGKTVTGAPALIELNGNHGTVVYHNNLEGAAVGQKWTNCWECATHGTAGESVAVYWDGYGVSDCLVDVLGESVVFSDILVRGDSGTVRNSFRLPAVAGTYADDTTTISLASPVNTIVTGQSFRIGGVRWLSGSGTPESAVAAPVGSLFSRTDGGAGTSLYVKQSGTGNTGWVGK